MTTIEGLGTAQKPDRLQAAFVAEQAAQCGYCTSGMIVAATALLARTPRPTREQIQEGLAGNLCRCGTHTRIIDAVLAGLRALDRALGRPNGLDYWRFSIVCCFPRASFSSTASTAFHRHPAAMPISSVATNASVVARLSGRGGKGREAISRRYRPPPAAAQFINRKCRAILSGPR